MIKNDLIAFTHTRWGFVYHRTQHILSRYAKFRRVFVVEEPIFSETNQISYRKTFAENNIEIIKPILSNKLNFQEQTEALKRVLDDLIEDEFIINFSLWYDTANAVEFSKHLMPISKIYDCQKEPSFLLNLPQEQILKSLTTELTANEIELLEKADIVYTSSDTLYLRYKNIHHNILNTPSSIDITYFQNSRDVNEALEQKKIIGPKFGYYGSLNSDVNFELVTDMADQHPSWNFIFIGARDINFYDELPRRQNIYFMGEKDYKYLPNYFTGWDAIFVPLKNNNSNLTIKKTHELLAIGKPIISTPQTAFSNDIQQLNIIKTAATATSFVAKCEETLTTTRNQTKLVHVIKATDDYLELHTWDSLFKNIKLFEERTLTILAPHKVNKFTTSEMFQI